MPPPGHHTGRLSGRNRMCKCRRCGKRTHSNVYGGGNTELCRACFDYTEAENGHSDNGHGPGKWVEGCPICDEERKAAETDNEPDEQIWQAGGGSYTTRPDPRCAAGCGLPPAPGDIYCEGCRSGMR